MNSLIHSLPNPPPLCMCVYVHVCDCLSVYAGICMYTPMHVSRTEVSFISLPELLSAYLRQHLS